MKNDAKFSCLPLSLYQNIYDGSLSLSRFSSMAREMGYDGIDINEYFTKDLSLREAESLSLGLQLPVICMCAYSDFTNCDPVTLRNEVQRALNNIEKAACLGAEYIRLTAGPAHPYCDDNTVDTVYACFEECAEEAKKHNIKILIENHLKALSWDYPDYNFDYRRMLLLWDRLKELPVFINFDTANSYALGNWEKLLEKLLERIEAIHINDISSLNPFKCSVAGEGIVCIDKMLQRLFDYGFNGWITIEEAAFQGAEGMKKSIENMKSLIGSIKSNTCKGENKT